MTRAALVAGITGALAAGFVLGWVVRSTSELNDYETPAPQSEDAPDVDAPRAAESAPDEPRAQSSRPPAPDGAVPAQRPVRARSPDARAPLNLRGEIARAFAEAHTKLPAPPPEELDALAKRAADEIESERVAYEAFPKSRVDGAANLLAQRAALRDRIGTLAGETEIVLQVRGGRVSQNALGTSTDAKSAAPIDLSTAPDRSSQSEPVTYSKGGLIPYGSVFVIDRAEVTIVLSEYEHAEAKAVLANRSLLTARGGPRRLHATFAGSAILRPADQGSVELKGDYAAAEMRLHGRVLAESAAPPDRPLAWTPDGAEGFLRDGVPARLQVRAGHGGGNPNTVDLVGSPNMYVNRVSPTPVWDDSAKPAQIGATLVWSDGAGQVPPGYVFRVQRVDWRTRLRDGETHSKFELRVGPSDPVVRCGKDMATDAGSWTGDVVIRPGEEGTVTLTCSYFTFGEAVVIGRVERK